MNRDYEAGKLSIRLNLKPLKLIKLKRINVNFETIESSQQVLAFLTINDDPKQAYN